MFTKFVLATTLGLCLFGVSFAQNSDRTDSAEAADAEREANNQEVKVAMLPVAVRIAIGIAAGRAGNPVTPLNKGEKDNQKPEPKASPRDSGSKGGNSGSRPGGGRKIGPN